MKRKRCGKCKKIKSLKGFYVDISKPDGSKPTCSDCCAIGRKTLLRYCRSCKQQLPANKFYPRELRCKSCKQGAELLQIHPVIDSFLRRAA